MGEQLELFKATLPNRPYCTDNLGGLTVRARQQALERRYIQANPPAVVSWLAFDIDYPNLLETRFREVVLPLPNLLVVNPENNHSHALYGLAAGVCRTDAAREKPLRLLAAVEHSLRELLDADPGYSGLIVKNPAHKHWDTYELEPGLWDLGQLSDYLTLPKRLPKRALETGTGRNVTLFERSRYFAYAEVLKHRLTGSYDSFYRSVWGFLNSANCDFGEALPDSEVRGIARSVAEWTWKKYVGRWDDETWHKVQAKRGKKSGQARRLKSADRRQQALDLATQGMTQSEVAITLNVAQSTVSRWLKN